MMGVSVSDKQIISTDVWYLENTKEFERRKLIIGRYRGNIAACLVETRKTDVKVFQDKPVYGKEAKKLIDREKTRILYKRSEILKSKGKPFGWTYGENKEIHNNKGEIIAIRQKRCDYFGQKEIIKEIPLKLQ